MLVKAPGELVCSTIAMPKDTNVYGDIFGGWLVSQMDLGGATMAHKLAKNRVTTVAINELIFMKPVKVGDTVSCFGEVLKTGNSSITIRVTAWVERFSKEEVFKVTSGIFVFVAIDGKGKPKTIDWDI